MSQSTDDLIFGLADDLPPVKQMARIREVLGMALVASLPLSLIWLAALGLRPDLRALDPLPPLFLPILAILVPMAVGGLISGLADAIPGREALMNVARWIAIASGGAAFATLAFADVGHLGQHARGAIHCILGAAFLAVPCVTLSARFVTKGAPARRGHAFFLACFGGMAVASFVVHLTCPDSASMHLVLGHALAPVIGASIALAGVLAILRLTAWRSGAA
jgi:hypothetical protein